MNIVFICNENSCRSQIAEILSKKNNKNPNLKFYSCGTNISSNINPYVFSSIKEIYNYEIDKNLFFPKTIDQLINQNIEINYLISMGCDIGCPIISKQYNENWNLINPKNLNYDEFKLIVTEIENKVQKLLEVFKNV